MDEPEDSRARPVVKTEKYLNKNFIFKVKKEGCIIMAKAKPKLKFHKTELSEALSDYGPDNSVKLAIWGVVAIFAIVLLVLYFAGLL